MESEHQAVAFSSPHQTGVAERSIGGYDGHAAYDVIYDVMVCNSPNGIGAGVAVKLHSEDFVIRVYFGLLSGGKEGMRIRMEHKLIDVHVRQHREDANEQGTDRRQSALSAPSLHLPEPREARDRKN